MPLSRKSAGNNFAPSRRGTGLAKVTIQMSCVVHIVPVIRQKSDGVDQLHHAVSSSFTFRVIVPLSLCQLTTYSYQMAEATEILR